MIYTLQFISAVVALAVGAWARYKFKSVWLKVLCFFLAVIAGIVVYLAAGMGWAATTPSPQALGFEVGHEIWGAFGASVGSALVGLLSRFPDRLLEALARRKRA
jgi:hypothetical protein